MENPASRALVDVLTIPEDPADFAETTVRADDTSDTPAASNTTDSARLLDALVADEDPLNLLEATAAIVSGPGGDDGGSSFVRLVRIAESTSPLDLAYPRPGRADPELPRLSGVARADVPDSVSATTPTATSAPTPTPTPVIAPLPPPTLAAPTPVITQPPTTPVVLTPVAPPPTPIARTHNVLAGDTGGMQEYTIPGHNYNIALVVDVSDSMQDTKWGDPPETRFETTKKVLTAFVNKLKSHEGSNVNIALISFAGDAQKENTSDDFDSVLKAIDNLEVREWTNYSAAFTEAKNWFDDQPTNYKNLTFFLSDGEPNKPGKENDPVDDKHRDELQGKAFAELISIAGGNKVHAIGIGEKVTKATLDKYDNTPETVFDSKTYEIHADFDNDQGVNDPATWKLAGAGEVKKSNDKELTLIPHTVGEAFSATMSAEHEMVVVDPNGAYFRFNAYKAKDWDAADLFTWRLLRWDDAAQKWGEVESGHTIVDGDVTTSRWGPGRYLLQFEVQDESDNGKAAWVSIDNIHIHNVGESTLGEAEIVLKPDDLQITLIGGHKTLVPAQMGDDTIRGGEGDDILFGDALNAAKLPWGVDGNPDKPADFYKTGLEALKDFLTLRDGQAPSDAVLYHYIKDHYEQYQFGAHNGQGGNDTSIGGPGNDILIGGAGDDTFLWENGDAGTVDEPAHDMIKDFGRGGGDPNGRDVLDLRDLLQGEENDSDLSHYLNFSMEGADTVVKISTAGQLNPDGTGFNQVIKLENVNLLDGLNDQNAIIKHLIDAKSLLIDQ